MSELDNPNRRISDAHLKGGAVGTATSRVKGSDPICKMPMRRPLPGIVILVHGVNDIGEAYPTQAAGICEGLNLRLGRKDITAGTWDVPRSCPEQRRASFERRADAQGYNAIIPFYWGYRPVGKATYEADQQRYEEELKRRGPAEAEAPYDAYYVDGRSSPNTGYQNVDCYGNRLDAHFCKNGGVFANATTNLIDMWGPGSCILGIAQKISRGECSLVGGDRSHPIYSNPHRIYFVLAAQRLANLIMEIRADDKAGSDTINVVGHSQGTLVAMLANFLVANDPLGYRPADCLILNHSPYSLETPWLEYIQSVGPQQTKRAREETLINLCHIIDAQRMPGPAAADLVSTGIAGSSAAGSEHYLRDNHGKVFNYFCLHDKTVSLSNVQGMGWQGVPPTVARRAGPALQQRVFVNGRAMSTPPGPYTLPEIDMPFLKNRDVPGGEIRNINAPQLPEFGYTFNYAQDGNSPLGPSDWDINSAALGLGGLNTRTEAIDDPRSNPPVFLGRVALKADELRDVERALSERGESLTLIRASRLENNRLWITRAKTPQELEDESQQVESEISHHSAIVRDQEASCYVTAFDLAIGRCKSYDTKKVDGGEFWQKLLRMADWRDSLIKEDREYYREGLLPKEIKELMNKPPCILGLVNETSAYVKDEVHCEIPFQR